MSTASSSSSAATLSVGIVVFPDVSQLDVTGPYEVFARMPATKVHVVAATSAPIRSESGLTIVPTLTFNTAPALDVVCVPGGLGVDAAMEEDALLAFLRLQARNARYVTSVCTGALVLGAAGLLQGYRATTHSLSLDLLPLFGARPVGQQIVIDRNRITGGGVTAGIDFGLVVASKLCGAATAHEIQLMIEYSPSPPFSAGSPSVAPADLVQVARRRQLVQSRRRIVAERVAVRLDHGANGPNGKSARELQRAPEALQHVKCDRIVILSTIEPEVQCLDVPTSNGASRRGTGRHDILDGFALRADTTTGVAIDSLVAGTTLVVNTRNSEYRFVVLFEPRAVLVKGGSFFPEATVVRFEGAGVGDSALKVGWILVGFRMEMWLGSVRIRSSRVRSVSIESVPTLWTGDGLARARS